MFDHIECRQPFKHGHVDLLTLSRSLLAVLVASLLVLVLRALAEAASKYLGQRIIVENRTGAAGTLGAASLVNARPDGYVIAQMPITVFRVPYMQGGGFNPLNDFSWIIHVSGYTFGVAVRADSPLKAARDVVEQDAKNSGRKLNVVAETDSPRLMLEMIKAGLGYTIAPYLTFLNQLRARELSGRPLKRLAVQRSLIRRKDRPANKAMQLFRSLLRSEIEKACREIAKARG